MAVDPRDITVTRAMVAEWLSEYDGQLKPTKKLHDYLASKISESEQVVDVSARTDIDGNTITLADLILRDLESYG